MSLVTLSDLHADLEAFRRRPQPRPHVHACATCYQDAPCGLPCATEVTTDEDEACGILRGDACVCGMCLRRAGLPVDAFCTSLESRPA